MAEYIERDAVLEKCREIAACEWNHIASPVSWADAYEQFAEDIEEIQTADVARVRHGRWIEPSRLYYGAKQYECSLCCSDAFWNKHSITEKYPYCPNCGAKMDLEG